MYRLALILVALLQIVQPDSGNNLKLGTPSDEGQIVNRVGYAFCYSETHEQPLWVTYELTKEEVLTKVAKRKDNFRKDPLVKTSSAFLADYTNSGYDRGHLAPAADMAWSEKAMSESFYLSNISPQNPSLNRGMWAQLERHCRNWAVENGKVHIVTGPVIGPNHTTIGANEVSIPHGYYKICVSVENQKAIAFLIPNQKPQRSLTDYVVSVDRLEALTGLDFLDQLPDEIENKIEADSDVNSWSFSSSSSQKYTSPDKEMETSDEGLYWVTDSSNKRHNSSCRWFKNSKGHLAPKSEGVPCKICGG